MSHHQSASCSRRINRARMPEFVGQLVRFIGRVDSVEGDTLLLEAPDGGEVRCLLSGADQKPSSLIVEVIGEVQEDLTLRQTSFLFNLDLQAVNESINVTFHPQFVHFFEPTVQSAGSSSS
eukprot:GHVS01015716.1.p1 GENE.GHVS01015716.1~~GHVS01015716.1.p1  ORF type:complete len:141 (+),score=17.84 GHVS01015716.1:62-424(+)